MADITMCKGNGCKVKERCYRYMATPSESQSYFSQNPNQGEKCIYFWPLDAKYDTTKID